MARSSKHRKNAGKIIRKLNQNKSCNSVESQLYTNLAPVTVPMMRFPSLNRIEDLSWINTALYRIAWNNMFVAGRSSSQLQGISEESKTYTLNCEFQFDLYFRILLQVTPTMTLRGNLECVLDFDDSSKEASSLVIALHTYGREEDEDARKQLERLVLMENDLVHFEITQCTSSIVQKFWQLETALSLRQQMWPPDQAESSSTRLVAMGVIVRGSKAVFVDNAIHIVKEWQLAKEANILLAQCGVPIFLCHAEPQTVCSMFNDVRTSLKEYRDDVVQTVEKHMEPVSKDVHELESNTGTMLSGFTKDVQELKGIMRKLLQDMQQVGQEMAIN
ncbi:hypothetical protein GUITHDRAFT_119157 [Guillardia theta CCMP2712]|uniref:Uncharacterized protein n=1 Tax=Guillardia theta (strain CCMP2712) TaxID=905079 RepID=L1IER1_GUITC|nr:hypothetical protein GUITHDRAFT_119157 [Guillardia theta CCMP2712]EKX34723.1 hypothetical protein GUITHDRAFT_119157 [Guillardia theta CCMP2712]|eukprot:XP_005821703.1 hypothetical protein GUITHDRAFT_119157 [Guillardia theta CCMP2712]